jgi:F-type H+-transporting ATPase subunit b
MMRRPHMAHAATATIAFMLVADAAHAEGMPQLDFANPLLISQVVWGAVIFIIFYLAVSRIGLPRVAAILDMRERTIGGDLDQARLAKANADAAIADLTEARRRAYAESQAALNAATQKAKQDAADQAAALNAKLDQQLKDSEAQIGAARAQAMGAIRGVATETAAAIVTRLTGRAPNQSSVDHAIGTLLAERGLAAA